MPDKFFVNLYAPTLLKGCTPRELPANGRLFLVTNYDLATNVKLVPISVIFQEDNALPLYALPYDAAPYSTNDVFVAMLPATNAPRNHDTNYLSPLTP